jgi:hypothetical protein
MQPPAHIQFLRRLVWAMALGSAAVGTALIMGRIRDNRTRVAFADAQSLQDRQNARAEESMTSHLSGDDQSIIVNAMRAAASGGEGQFLMIRFPSAACTDLGRRINSAQHGWGSTLQGRPADIYRFWEKELRGDPELLLKYWSSPTESREISDYRWYGASNGALVRLLRRSDRRPPLASLSLPAR